MEFWKLATHACCRKSCIPAQLRHAKLVAEQPQTTTHESEPPKQRRNKVGVVNISCMCPTVHDAYTTCEATSAQQTDKTPVHVHIRSTIQHTSRANSKTCNTAITHDDFAHGTQLQPRL